MMNENWGRCSGMLILKRLACCCLSSWLIFLLSTVKNFGLVLSPDLSFTLKHLCEASMVGQLTGSRLPWHKSALTLRELP